MHTVSIHRKTNTTVEFDHGILYKSYGKPMYISCNLKQKENHKTKLYAIQTVCHLKLPKSVQISDYLTRCCVKGL